MSIGISDEHVELAKSLRQWAADCGGVEAVRAAESEADATFADVWKQAVEMGVPTIGLPEAAGGGGGSVLDQAVALEACAHQLVPRTPAGGRGRLLAARRDEGLAGALGEGAVVGLALDLLTDKVWDPPQRDPLPAAQRRRRLVRGAGRGLAATPAIGLDLSRRFGTVEVDLSAPGVVPVEWLEADLVHRAVVTFAARRRPGSPGGASRRRSTTPRCASSSGRRSAPSRRSSTCARRCSRPPRP